MSDCDNLIGWAPNLSQPYTLTIDTDFSSSDRTLEENFILHGFLNSFKDGQLSVPASAVKLNSLKIINATGNDFCEVSEIGAAVVAKPLSARFVAERSWVRFLADAGSFYLQ